MNRLDIDKIADAHPVRWSGFVRSRHGAAAVAAAGLTLAGVLSLTVLSGCGSGGRSISGATSAATSTRSQKGNATISITWPARTATKLIPVASNSITVSFTSGTSTVSYQTVARPTTGNTSTLTFTGLPAGAITLNAAAYPNTDGTGTAQASASTTVTIVAGSTITSSLVMGSTITGITVTPAAPSVAAGSTTTLTATATDINSATVLTSSSITWASSNTAVATVSSSGVVTGVAAGTATITATDSESGKSGTTTATVTSTSSTTTVVSLANAYIATLTSAQQTAVVTAFNVTDAEKWSNLPAPPNSDGTTNLRNGVAYSSLTTAQQTAWNNLVNYVLTSGAATNGYGNDPNGIDQFNKIRAADYDLRSAYSANSYSGDYEYLAFVGTPSTTGQWILQLGGHHNCHNYYFTGTTLNTTTPYHLGTEPADFTYNGTTYSPLSDQKTAVTNLLSSFTTAQLATAKTSSSFGDLYLGAGQDARADFPTASGVLVTNLTTAQQTLVKAAIDAWVSKSPNASSYETEYFNELGSTYVLYAGNSGAPTTVFTAQGDYLRIQGPHVWIEFVCQNGVVVQNKIHYHTIWRDYATDYNYQTAGFTLVNHSN